MTENITSITAADETIIDFAPVQGFVNTCDLETLDGKMRSANAINSAVSLNDHVGEVLRIVDVITMPGIRKGRNGQADTPCQNTYLIDADGTTYFSQSDGVKRSINTTLSIFKKCDVGKGYLPLVCKSDVLPNGNTIKTLVVVDDEQ
jgi:hypothetical protein